MNPQPPTKTKATNNFEKEFANRFRDFRTRFIDKVLTKAAEKLQTSKGQLSSIESGRKRPNLEIIEIMIKEFNLNTEWLATGKGDKQTSGPAKMTASTSLQEAHRNIDVVIKSMRILDAKMNQIFDIIEAQQKQIDLLTDRLNQSGR